MKKSLKLVALALSATLALGFAGCGKSADNAATNGEKKTIKIGVSPEPHKGIAEVAKKVLKDQGYNLEIVEFSDYVIPNTSLESGELDANFFQHVPYLEKFNTEQKTNLTYTAKVHLEPMGVYSKKAKNLSEIKNGAEIAIPNDATNGARALRVLEKEGLIKLKSGDLVSKLDITENPKNIKITELDAPQLPRILGDVDAAVINTNFALQGGLTPGKDAIAIESKNSPYANIIAVKKGNEEKEYIKALTKAFNSPEVKKYIEDTYKGDIVPAF